MKNIDFVALKLFEALRARQKCIKDALGGPRNADVLWAAD